MKPVKVWSMTGTDALQVQFVHVKSNYASGGTWVDAVQCGRNARG